MSLFNSRLAATPCRGRMSDGVRRSSLFRFRAKHRVQLPASAVALEIPIGGNENDVVTGQEAQALFPDPTRPRGRASGGLAAAGMAPSRSPARARASSVSGSRIAPRPLAEASAFARSSMASSPGAGHPAVPPLNCASHRRSFRIRSPLLRLRLAHVDSVHIRLRGRLRHDESRSRGSRQTSCFSAEPFSDIRPILVMNVGAVQLAGTSPASAVFRSARRALQRLPKSLRPPRPSIVACARSGRSSAGLREYPRRCHAPRGAARRASGEVQPAGSPEVHEETAKARDAVSPVTARRPLRISVMRFTGTSILSRKLRRAHPQRRRGPRATSRPDGWASRRPRHAGPRGACQPTISTPSRRRGLPDSGEHSKERRHWSLMRTAPLPVSPARRVRFEPGCPAAPGRRGRSRRPAGRACPKPSVRSSGENAAIRWLPV